MIYNQLIPVFLNLYPLDITFFIQENRMLYITLSTTLFTSIAALLGNFTVLQKKNLISEVVAHAILPGIALSYIILHQPSNLSLLIGAMSTSLLALLSINYTIHHTKINQDTAIAFNTAIFFGIGIFLLGLVQKKIFHQQNTLNNFLLGNAATLLQTDLILFSIISLLILLTSYVFFKPFLFMIFDKNFSQSIGFPIRFLELLLTFLVVITIVIAVQTIGVVLITSVFITPTITARFWTNQFKYLPFITILISIIATFLGYYVSYHYTNMPTGPWITVSITLISYLSFLLAPHKGLLPKYLRARELQKRILMENFLKNCMETSNASDLVQKTYESNRSDLKREANFSDISYTIELLLKKKWVIKIGGQYLLTDLGIQVAKDLATKHSLWEKYSIQYLNINSKNTSNNAEYTEHFLTPALKKQIAKVLKKNPINKKKKNHNKK